jgi:8-oxo-dGTP pyrophosphatase MutT (NUDIX family)
MPVDFALLKQALGARPAVPDSAALARPHAVVAAILRQAEQDTELLLIRRAEHESDPWSGHMALPGGHHSAGDESLLGTALRETAEEVGLDLRRDAEYLGCLGGVRAIARGRVRNLEIIPLVFALHGPAVLALDAREVTEAAWAKLSYLRSGAAHTDFDYEYEGTVRALPAYNVGGRIVWGLTYRIVNELLAVSANL